MIKRLYNKVLPKNEGPRNLLTLLTGSTIAQVLPVLFAPLLTRIYTPESFGLLGIVLAITNILAVAGSFKYELAVMHPNENSKAEVLTSLGIFVAFCFSLLTLLVCFLGYLFIDSLETVGNLGLSIFFIPCFVFVMAAYQPINYWLTRNKLFKESARNRVVQSFFLIAVSIASGSLFPLAGLTIGYLSGWLGMFLYSFYQAYRNGFRFSLNFKEFFQVGKEYKRFPLFNLVPSVLNAGSASIPVIVIGRYFSDIMLGQFNLIRQILGTPINFLSSAISQVFFEKVSAEIRAKRPVMPVFIKVIKPLTLASSILIIVILLFGPSIFSIVFGREWKVAGEYARILVFSLGIQFIVSPLSVLFPALNSVKLISIWQLGYCLLILTLYLFSRIDFKSFLLLLVSYDVISYSVYLIFMVTVGKKHDMNLYSAKQVV